MIEKFKYYVSLGTLLAAFAMLILCLFWLVYPYQTIKFTNSPFPVGHEVYKINECLRIHMTGERFTAVPSTAIFRFTDGITFTMLPMQFQKTPGKFDNVSVSVRIPPILPPGKYYLDMSFTYEINPIRNIVVNARTQEFEVK